MENSQRYSWQYTLTVTVRKVSRGFKDVAEKEDQVRFLTFVNCPKGDGKGSS